MKIKKKIGGLYLEPEDVGPFARQNNFDLNELDLKSRSLLNRNSAGKIKFSHKSILEYFLALELYQNSDFKMHFDFESMAQANSFYIEMCKEDTLAYSTNLNKEIPFNNTLHRYLKSDLKTLLSYTGGKSITILNPHSLNDRFFIGLTNIEYLNILVTQKDDVDKILLIPNLKKICLLNESRDLKYYMRYRVEFTDSEFAKAYLRDFKTLIKSIDPEVDKNTLQKRKIFGYTDIPIDDIKGIHENVNSDLYELYTATITNLIRQKITEQFAHITFVFSPLNEKGITSE